MPGAPGSCNGLAAGDERARRSSRRPTLPSRANFRFFAINANGQIWEDIVTLFPMMPEIGTPAIGSPLK